MKDKTTVDQHAYILVVEDNVDLSRMLAQLLERASYQVVLAADGQTALTQAKQHHPDLILMDLSLPDIDGWEAVTLLRKMPEFRDTPIMAVTAHVSAADQARALAVGCTVHVGKPFKTRSLLQTIEQLLKNGANGHAS
ncbi:MAG TPA: response regulator [Ktedonosporobacter sp.]|nr:response regulator [Ktedonosporobacter sp.]